MRLSLQLSASDKNKYCFCQYQLNPAQFKDILELLKSKGIKPSSSSGVVL